MYDIIILGNGVAANTAISHLENEKILQISADRFIKNTSYHCPAIISQNGIERGISELGDILLDSYDAFLDFFERTKPPGVYPVQQYILGDESNAEFKKRYKNIVDFEGPIKGQGAVLKSFLIDERIYLDSLKDKALDKRDDFIKSYQDHGDHVELIGLKNSYKTKKLLIATNSFSFEDYHKTKFVKGSYLETRGKLSEESFILSFDKFNLIYNKECESLRLTSANAPEGHYLADRDALFSMYEKALEHFELPSFDSFSVKTSIRTKGKKRMPWWGEVSKNVYEIKNLYKNGFTFAFLAAKDFSSKLQDCSEPRGI